MNSVDMVVSAPADTDGPQARILIVDDDKGLREDIAAYLLANGYAVETARDASAMDRALARSSFEVVILDVMMPGEDGLSICRRLSAVGSPAIIIMSAMGEQIDRIVGLELGADDYLAKPSNPRELLARIRAVLRRRGAKTEDEIRPRSARHYIFAGYDLDPLRRRLAAPDGTVVLLTRGEMGLLNALLDAGGGILSREQLNEGARGDDADSRVIDVQVSRLRRKLGDGDGQEIIRTVRGLGYRMAVGVARS